MRISIYLTLIIICLTFIVFSGCIDRTSSVRMNPVLNKTSFSIDVNTTEIGNDVLVSSSTIHNTDTNTTESDPFIGTWYSSHGNRILQIVDPNGNITMFYGDHAITHLNGKWIKTGENTYFVRILESDESPLIINNFTISYDSTTDALFDSYINFNLSWSRIDRRSP